MRREAGATTCGLGLPQDCLAAPGQAQLQAVRGGKSEVTRTASRHLTGTRAQSGEEVRGMTECLFAMLPQIVTGQARHSEMRSNATDILGLTAAGRGRANSPRRCGS